MKEKLTVLGIVLFSVFGGIFFGVHLVYKDYDIGPLNLFQPNCKEPITMYKNFNGQQYKVVREDSFATYINVYYWDNDCCCEKFFQYIH